MYSIVLMAKEMGFTVSGSDREEGEFTRLLVSHGVTVKIGYDPEGISTAAIVVYSLAIDKNSKELEYARHLGIPTVSRADFLSYLMKEYKCAIGVSGTHGKSTSTAMLGAILDAAGVSPTLSVGAAHRGGEPYISGGRDFLVYESCEYRDSFLAHQPSVLAVTNIELDHTDYFDSEQSVMASFTKAINSATAFSVLNIDDKNTRKILERVLVPTVTYGASSSAAYRYTLDTITDVGCEFSVYRMGRGAVKFRLNIPGAYNVANAMLAIATAKELGVADKYIKDALFEFRLPKRRLEWLGEFNSRTVLYDYAHHPSEICAVINAVKTWYSKGVTVVFKPHTYSRTGALWQGFVESLSLADFVIVTDVYAAREDRIEGVSAERLAHDIRGAVYSDDSSVDVALSDTEGVILLLGAGNFDKVIASLKMGGCAENSGKCKK